MRRLMIALAASVLLAGGVYGMDARPLASNLPPVPHWHIVATVTIDGASGRFIYTGQGEFDDEAACKVFVDTDPGFQMALTILTAEANIQAGDAGAAVAVGCESTA